ncbi:MAG: peptidoglycan DD-metalloendopeptidase family protein [Chloroflexota bacterium]|nr:peptidoglycan DD-metalloendopeptidase family protein [Chloroflexota bacterium]
MRSPTFFLFCLVIIVAFVINAPAAAQPQCGVVESVAFPVDTSVFRLMQDFAVPNYRHRGWFHTGEDWWGGRGQSLGQPVRAIANGRVTLSSPIAWGRDGGVIILEHTFEDGTIYYSQYGHLAESDTVTFPRPYTCVSAGEILGVIAESRPAPHLHFEIRITNFDLPGPGYTEADPFAEGYRRPSKMLYNWQAHLSPAHLWYADLIDERGPLSPPVVLSDNSLIYIDTGRVARLTSDGRVMWRYNLEANGVTLLPDGDAAIIVYASGRMQRIDINGAPGESWETGIAPDSAPLRNDDTVVFHTRDGALAGLSADLRTVLWRLADVPPIERWASSGRVLALVTVEDELLVLSAVGEVISRQPLNAAASLAVGVDGRLYGTAGGGMFAIDAPYISGASAASANALLHAADGRVYLFDNGIFTAFDAAQQIVWQYAVPGLSGAFGMAQYGDILLLTSTHGFITTVRAGDGALCGTARIYGDDRAQQWQALGADGVLRVAVADQIIGFDWNELLGACGG